MKIWLTCCNFKAQDVCGRISVISLNWKFEIVQISYEGIQEGDIFKIDLNIKQVIFSDRTTQGNWNKSICKMWALYMFGRENTKQIWKLNRSIFRNFHWVFLKKKTCLPPRSFSIMLPFYIYLKKASHFCLWLGSSVWWPLAIWKVHKLRLGFLFFIYFPNLLCVHR